jgi:hypothetical protein
MQHIEPFFNWRKKYIAAEDKKSPFFGRVYNELQYTQKIYNHYIHPQWDDFGASTLYLKILFCDYDDGFAIMEFLGEWNDALHNDVMFLKREVIDPMVENGVFKFILIGENVLNYHGDDNCYYEEWWDDIKDDDGWVAMLNFRPHVVEEMVETELQYYVNLEEVFEEVNWRPQSPKKLFQAVDTMILKGIKKLVF